MGVKTVVPRSADRSISSTCLAFLWENELYSPLTLVSACQAPKRGWICDYDGFFPPDDVGRSSARSWPFSVRLSAHIGIDYNMVTVTQFSPSLMNLKLGVIASRILRLNFLSVWRSLLVGYSEHPSFSSTSSMLYNNGTYSSHKFLQPPLHGERGETENGDKRAPPNRMKT